MPSRALLVIGLSFLCLVAMGQQPGHQKQNAHPSMPWQRCSLSGGCQSQPGAVTIDANWDWTHKKGTYTNCYQGNSWDPTDCPDADSCAANCALDAGSVPEYESTYGISTDNGALKLKFVTNGPGASNGKNVGSRTYLLDEAAGLYHTFTLKNREFTFDVDVSQLPCGLNGALYFVRMDADGGMSKYPGNKAGASYGTGYCDAQCPHDIKFINGQANFPWHSSPTDPNAGTGHYGTCCSEMDVWESNSLSTALTPHVCTVDNQTRCEGTECGDGQDRERGLCDKSGCDWNPFRVGDQQFFGNSSSFAVDSSRPFTVVTQFVSSDGTDKGELSSIRRFYIQDGKRINTTAVTVPGQTSQFDAISDEFCAARASWMNDTDSFGQRGGLKRLGEQAEHGMVLVMSLWDDHAAQMLWLDSAYPPTADPTSPGTVRGPCPTSSGVPDQVESQWPDATVVYSNIRYGEIGSTTSGPSPPPSPPSSGCKGCGYACQGSCSQCGHCNTKPGGLAVGVDSDRAVRLHVRASVLDDVQQRQQRHVVRRDQPTKPTKPTQPANPANPANPAEPAEPAHAIWVPWRKPERLHCALPVQPSSGLQGLRRGMLTALFLDATWI